MTGTVPLIPGPEEISSGIRFSANEQGLRWKLFPFSLIEKAKQWYTHAIGSMNGDWEELTYKFCLEFSPIGSLPNAIFDFEQYKKESIGATWARFSVLLHTGPDLSLPDSILL